MITSKPAAVAFIAGCHMGKRKSSKPPPKKVKPKLDKAFNCPFCNSAKSVTANMDWETAQVSRIGEEILPGLGGEKGRGKGDSLDQQHAFIKQDRAQMWRLSAKGEGRGASLRLL